MKPMAERISQWMPCKEIIYKCPKCDSSFATLGNKNKFCYNCGTPIDWNVHLHLKESFSAFDDVMAEKALLETINQANLQM